MVTSETQICNLALTRLGHTMIASLGDGTKAADLCTLHYPICRDSLLRGHPWNFAITRAALSRDVTNPNHEFSYRFLLPVNCLKVLRTSWEAEGLAGSWVYGFGLEGYAAPLPYRIEGRYLLTSESSVSIEYIARIEDVSQFDDLFVDVLAQRLAAEIAMALTDNQTATQRMWEMYQQKLVEARIMDAQEGTARDIVDLSGWLIARQ